jgi:hypothetical protein
LLAIAVHAFSSSRQANRNLAHGKQGGAPHGTASLTCASKAKILAGGQKREDRLKATSGSLPQHLQFDWSADLEMRDLTFGWTIESGGATVKLTRPKAYIAQFNLALFNYPSGKFSTTALTTGLAKLHPPGWA